MNDVAVNIDHPNYSPSDWLAPDCHGLNFFEIDNSVRDLISLYLPDDLQAHMTPHFHRMGELAGGKLDEWSRLAERHTPILHRRDSYGRDQDWIEFHPAYREMEKVAFQDFGIHCMAHNKGVLGWPEKVPQIAKYIFQYLFVQAEFGLMCPISVIDTSTVLIEKYGSEEVKQKFLGRMRSQDLDQLLKSAQFMTEKTGGSDVGNIELAARFEDGHWRIYGEKWFCSCADGDVALLLARPEGAPGGSGGLGLFALPRTLDDGSRNAYTIVRLKDKLGTKSMASGEITFDGAIVYPLGEVGAHPNRGLKQMMDQVNLSRLSHGVRASAMMRRCLNEALTVARGRQAFGKTLMDMPLLRRQLMKILVPTEQSLSVFLYAARLMQAAAAGDEKAERRLRIVTPLLKFRACRDNITVAQGSMEVRGGNGFIEDWINPRLVRDAFTGVLWEGTSNINALDVTTRAIAKVGAHEDLAEDLHDLAANTPGLPGQVRGSLSSTIDQATAFAEEVAASGNETLARRASDALYHTMGAVLMSSEGARLGQAGGDARRMITARMLIDHKLRPQDPLSAAQGVNEQQAVSLVLGEAPVDLATAQEIAAA
jgi:alkylation response protein AidB-like acyl-CoA dehydrogenase